MKVDLAAIELLRRIRDACGLSTLGLHDKPWKEIFEETLDVIRAKFTAPPIVLPEIRPGVVIVHRLNHERMLVLELEGDGAGPWFTARRQDLATWRLHRTEVEVPKVSDELRTGQYL